MTRCTEHRRVSVHRRNAIKVSYARSRSNSWTLQPAVAAVCAAQLRSSAHKSRCVIANCRRNAFAFTAPQDQVTGIVSTTPGIYIYPPISMSRALVIGGDSRRATSHADAPSDKPPTNDKARGGRAARGPFRAPRQDSATQRNQHRALTHRSPQAPWFTPYMYTQPR